MNPDDQDHERAFSLFVGYAHHSEAVKDRLLTNLRVLQRLGLVSTWTDRAIPPGADWHDAIDEAIEHADAVIFVVSEYFLASDFCMDEELPNRGPHPILDLSARHDARYRTRGLCKYPDLAPKCGSP